MESQWLQFAKRLQAIALTGRYYGRDEFDLERYSEVEAIANEMLALLASVPVERIEELVSTHAKGYVTPRVDVRGAVIENGAVLLVRERSDGLWTLPGGFADVGKSPAANVEKEVWEEAGLRVRASRLYGIRHMATDTYPPDVRDFYKVFFLCVRDEGQDSPRAGCETIDAAFFRRDSLPSLSTRRVIASDIHAAFEFAANQRMAAQFN